MSASRSTGSIADEVAGSRRERPWLYPSNRKLRHLQGISVRNLVVSPQNRARGKTIDDDDIPNTLKSPSKILGQKESRALHQSRSYTDLNLQTNGDRSNARDNKKAELPGRPRSMRRRSTLPWSAPTAQARQVRLEDIMKSRMADTWFSIHCDGLASPVYISEVVERTTNPSFQNFDLNLCGPQISRRDQVVLRLWAKTALMKDYTLLVELQLHLQSLQFLGKSLESFHQPLPANAILFHFADGVYTNLTDIPPVWTPLPLSVKGAQSAGSGAAGVQPTSSYDALMRLANLDECIQDALATRERLEAQIGFILEENQGALQTMRKVSHAREKLSRTKTAVAAERRLLRATTKRKDELIASIHARRESMSRGRETQEKARSHLPDARVKLSASAKLLGQTTDEAKGQIRRIAEDLLTIYPIEPIPNKPLAFTIAGHALPNSSFGGDIDCDAVAAALGYTAHLVYLLSFYLSAPVPYPINPFLSTSHIRDPISASLPQRTYPLYPVNVQYRFDYGVFLLNKDIEFLLSKQGLRVLDIRHTLPNLKYLLYVLTARSGEMPARKAGGIRALLLPGRLTPSLSRRGSEDSVVYGRSVFPGVSAASSSGHGGVVDRGPPATATGANGEIRKGKQSVPSTVDEGTDRLEAASERSLRVV